MDPGGGGQPNNPTIVKADPADLTWKGQEACVVLRRTAEMWQFFAFVYAAVLTLVLALLDEVMRSAGGGRAVVKVVLFLILGYALLANRPVRRGLVWLLERWKTERY